MYSLLNIVPTICFIVGFCLGFSIKKNDKLPEIKTPTKIIKEIKEERKEEERKQEEEEKKKETDIYLENIDNYPYNQKDI